MLVGAERKKKKQLFTHQELFFTLRVAFQDCIDHVWSLRKIETTVKKKDLVLQKFIRVFSQLLTKSTTLISCQQ